MADEAKAYLRQLEKLDMLICNKLIEQSQWRDVALGITANMEGEKVQSSGSQSKMADALNKAIDMEAEIDSLIDRLIDTKTQVIKTIEAVESPTEYRILHLKYVQYKTLEDIADMLGRSYSAITTTHGRALASVQKILNERAQT